jgi:hypothetical protein
VQVLTGYGYFGHKVARREETPQCHHCDALDDTAEHTLQVCQAWRRQRVDLIDALDIGGVLSLSKMVEAYHKRRPLSLGLIEEGVNCILSSQTNYKSEDVAETHRWGPSRNSFT